MMKMNGRDSAECQNWEMEGHNGHFWKIFKSLKDKKCYSVFSFIKPKKIKREELEIRAVVIFLSFFSLERETPL